MTVLKNEHVIGIYWLNYCLSTGYEQTFYFNGLIPIRVLLLLMF